MDVMDTVEIVEIAASPALMGLGETAVIAALVVIVLASLAIGYLHEMRAGRVDPARQLAYAKAAVVGASHQFSAVRVRFLAARRDRAREERAAAIQARLDRNCNNRRYVA